MSRGPIPGQEKDGAVAIGVTLSGRAIVRCKCLVVFYVARSEFRRRIRNEASRLQCNICYRVNQRIHGAKRKSTSDK